MLSSIFSDICSAFTITEVAADAPPAVEHEESLEVAEKGEEEEAEEEEEEDEEEPEDQLPRLTEECAQTKPCKPHTHHYEECAARVTSAQEAGEELKEDCVEEFFHMLHCAAQCAAPKIWQQLK